MRRLILIAILASAAQVVVAMEDTTDDGRTLSVSAATHELEAALQTRHPSVAQWSIRPLLSERSLQALPNAKPASVQVTRMGARSAVRLTWSQTINSRAQTLWFAVSGMTLAVVTTRDAPPRSSLSSADGELLERDAMSSSCTLVTAVDQLQNMRTRHALRVGAVICRDAIEPRPAVARGEDVVVHYLSPRVSIIDKGVAQADAYVGQTVSVINSASRGAFRAVVTALKEVVVYE